MRPAFVLASASPRRRELLAALGLTFDVRPADLDEDAIAAGHTPEQGVLAVARAKAAAIARAETTTLAADTIVVLDGRVLGKPADDADAHRMLSSLRGRSHRVFTAVCVRRGAAEEAALIESTVAMRPFGDDEIAAYVASGRGRDKAGSYGVQDEGFAPVASITGCYCNVMGLPLWTAGAMLARAGVDVPQAPAGAFPRCAVCPHATAR